MSPDSSPISRGDWSLDLFPSKGISCEHVAPKANLMENLPQSEVIYIVSFAN